MNKIIVIDTETEELFITLKNVSKLDYDLLTFLKVCLKEEINNCISNGKNGN
jgi:hypothetical protein